MQKITKYHVLKGVYQRLGVTLKRWLTPKSWSTPVYYTFLRQNKERSHFPQESTNFWVSTSFIEQHLNDISPFFIACFA